MAQEGEAKGWGVASTERSARKWLAAEGDGQLLIGLTAGPNNYGPGARSVGNVRRGGAPHDGKSGCRSQRGETPGERMHGRVWLRGKVCRSCGGDQGGGGALFTVQPVCGIDVRMPQHHVSCLQAAAPLEHPLLEHSTRGTAADSNGVVTVATAV
jgi:hypothetical protein